MYYCILYLWLKIYFFYPRLFLLSYKEFYHTLPFRCRVVRWPFDLYWKYSEHMKRIYVVIKHLLKPNAMPVIVIHAYRLPVRTRITEIQRHFWWAVLAMPPNSLDGFCSTVITLGGEIKKTTIKKRFSKLS